MQEFFDQENLKNMQLADGSFLEKRRLEELSVNEYYAELSAFVRLQEEKQKAMEKAHKDAEKKPAGKMTSTGR